MNRRLLGRVGWPSVFFLVAGLVFAGLGWVTYAALEVEQAQREAAARAELGNNLRVALWRLDGRMLPALGVEDSRPFYHYDSADPVGVSGSAATPLLAATLPDWMRLHFQLDPAKGWTSNQAPTDRGECERVREAWADVGLSNFGGSREVALSDLKTRFPVRATCELFGARDRAFADSLPELMTSEPNPMPGHVSQPPDATLKPPPSDPISNIIPDPKTDSYRVLGFEVCLRQAEQLPIDPQQQAANSQRGDNDLPQQKKYEQPKSQRGGGMSQSNVAMRGVQGQKGAENDRGVLEYLKRAESFSKALDEAKNAYDGPLARNSVQGNYQNSMLNNEQKFQQGPLGKNDVIPPIVLAPVGPPVPASPGVTSPVGGVTAPDKNPGKLNLDAAKERIAKDKEAKEAAAQKQREEEIQAFGALGIEALKSALAERDRRESAVDRAKDEVAQFGWLLRSRDSSRRAPSDNPEADNKASVKPPAPGIAGEERPPVPAVLPPAPHAVHLGSMRPQWVTGPDGGETLMLVRAARLEFRNPQDNKTVYQGIVIDWPKLEAKLKDEVRDLFPDARLVAVRDPEGVSPDRAMTALPVQLEPGVDAVLPRAGWTPLRIGLVLAWVAAIIAIGAVGFSGWTLIDLAERRIRFVSAVTHELRTPLTSLRLYLDLLVSGMITDEAKRQEYLNTLATESDRLHRLIDNVLDFAKLEKRRKNGDIKPVKVNELLDLLRQTWTDRLAQEDRELVVISTLSPECEVTTDSAMIQQIAGNLIDNARKYARDAVDKRIWLWAKPGPGKTIMLEVEDRGPGVPANERRTIFKPFRRGELAESTAGGAGLGLALAKSWAEVLGARLGYRPADGGTGACFRLELPGK
ncbi:MAG: HAMP domain-containing histidine kinase [Planctomycetes bacterium]|nr:HAMP domain-containing histidine kinase [Planctomycetota bacterium]